MRKALLAVCVALLVGSAYAQLAGIFYVTRIKSFSAAPLVVCIGEQVKFTGLLESRFFVWCPLASETVEAVDSNGVTLGLGLSDSEGKFTIYWRPGFVGVYTVRAVYRGDAWNYACSSSPVDVDVVSSSGEKVSKNFERIIGDYGLYIAVAIVAVVALFFMARKPVLKRKR